MAVLAYGMPPISRALAACLQVYGTPLPFLQAFLVLVVMVPPLILRQALRHDAAPTNKAHVTTGAPQTPSRLLIWG